jgi:citrate/tricarballylate utilization protein
MTICNACRYCEGYCAVFPAMERRLTFSDADLNYLANLCHNCSACYDACQYAPPHEFAVDVPKVLAEIREQSYRQYALPHWYGGPAWPSKVALILAVSIGSFLWAVWRNFTFSHTVMTTIFGAASILVLGALAAGKVRFWRESGVPLSRLANPAALRSALRDALTLKYLDNNDGRRWFHHLTFYGFLLCFAATSVAAIYHYMLGWEAPYAYLSLPVVLGTLGGIGLLIGTAGLYAVKRTATSFLVLLFLTSFTGLLLLALRETPAMRWLLGIHLGVVLALFVTLPYGKFVHGIYRLNALVRYALEQRTPISGIR